LCDAWEPSARRTAVGARRRVQPPGGSGPGPEVFRTDQERPPGNRLREARGYLDGNEIANAGADAVRWLSRREIDRKSETSPRISSHPASDPAPGIARG